MLKFLKQLIGMIANKNVKRGLSLFYIFVIWGRTLFYTFDNNREICYNIKRLKFERSFHKMLEIFITVVAAIVVGAILVKFWRPILGYTLTFIMFVLAIIILIPMFILSLPVRLYTVCVSEEKLEEKVVRSYDWMLHEASTQEELEKGRRTIKWAQSILRQRKEKRQEKFVKKLLEEAKWVL